MLYCPDGVGVEPAAHAEPKLAGLELGQYGGHGLLAEVGLEMDRRLRLKLGGAHRPGPDATTLWLRVASSPSDRLDLGALMLTRGVGDSDGGIGGLVALAEGRFRITPALYALAQYSRIWSLDSASRYFGILQSFDLALGASWAG